MHWFFARVVLVLRWRSNTRGSPFRLFALDAARATCQRCMTLSIYPQHAHGTVFLPAWCLRRRRFSLFLVHSSWRLGTQTPPSLESWNSSLRCHLPLFGPLSYTPAMSFRQSFRCRSGWLVRSLRSLKVQSGCSLKSPNNSLTTTSFSFLSVRASSTGRLSWAATFLLLSSCCCRGRMWLLLTPPVSSSSSSIRLAAVCLFAAMAFWFATQVSVLSCTVQ
mmetsp:Transcript_36020/g.88635  ORF Transcript_36020/g.88635 Transcript_36020/m.88635 type:complete len:220 (-) Transcript_36020:424-1083(-)